MKYYYVLPYIIKALNYRPSNREDRIKHVRINGSASLKTRREKVTTINP